jgi:hypothetical protein
MENTLTIYVKPNSNCHGMPLTSFSELSPTWQGEQLVIPFEDGGARRNLPLVGWEDLFFGSPCSLRVVRVRTSGHEGFLIYGGNCGIRILDERAESIPGMDDHLPRGYGTPILWIDHVEDLPEEARAVVAPLHT